MKKFIKFIFNFKEKEEIFRTMRLTMGQNIKWHAARGVRNTSIFALFLGTGWASAVTYNKLHPVTVYAEKVIEVPTEQKLSDFPMLVRICDAESGGKQFFKNGNVVRGVINASDVGICQINEAINNDEARKLGYDIFTEKGNIQMAIHMFVNQGVRPWKSSMCIKNGWGIPSDCD